MDGRQVASRYSEVVVLKIISVQISICRNIAGIFTSLGTSIIGIIVYRSCAYKQGATASAAGDSPPPGLTRTCHLKIRYLPTIKIFSPPTLLQI